MQTIIICILINLVISFATWQVFTYQGELNIHFRLAALWAFIANTAIFGFNFWLAMSLA